VLKTITQFTALFLGILLILIFYSYSLLRHYVVKPIEQIIHQISDGQKIELRKYEAQNYDEISLLGDTLNNALTQAALAYQTLEMQQKELQESRDRFAALITNLPGITFRCAIDKDWTVLFLSGLVEEITGYPASDFLNNAVRSFVSLIHPDDLDYIFATVDKAMNENRPYLVEYRIITRTGEIRWIHERGRMICNEMGQFCFFDGFGIDITNQKAVGLELARSHADLEQFSYAVSHDMRQPLRMVTSYLSLIESALEDKLDEDTRQFLTFAVDGAKRMDSMILSLLDYSRMGRKNDAFQLIASQTAVNEALLFLEPALKSSGGKIDVQGDWVDVVANRDELTRLLQNLIGNALKYHAENEPPLVQVLAITTQNTFRVEVKDSGIGIVPNQIDRLFKVFSRLQSRSRFEGTGVGLALCRKIVEHHGGKIGVESEGVGCGCTFWFELPIATVATSSKPNDI
jgi:PAS domain S-box-containing protein